MAQIMVNSPSRMKIHAQPGLPPIPCILLMAAARRPPTDDTVNHEIQQKQKHLVDILNAPATVAEEKNTATRPPSSERLYQLD